MPWMQNWIWMIWIGNDVTTEDMRPMLHRRPVTSFLLKSSHDDFTRKVVSLQQTQSIPGRQPRRSCDTRFQSGHCSAEIWILHSSLGRHVSSA